MTSIRSLAMILASAGILCGAQPFAAAENVVADDISTQYQKVRLVRVVGGLERPWAVAFLPDGRYLVTERPGRLNIVAGGGTTPVTGVPAVHAFRQGGLFDVALHPDFADNGWATATSRAWWSRPARTRPGRPSTASAAATS